MMRKKNEKALKAAPDMREYKKTKDQEVFYK